MRKFIQFCKDEFPIILMTLLAIGLIIIGVRGINKPTTPQLKGLDTTRLDPKKIKGTLITETEREDCVGYLSVIHGDTVIMAEIILIKPWEEMGEE